jgi:prepilin-type N-terminal cleavage/methylation domain-containing protein
MLTSTNSRGFTLVELLVVMLLLGFGFGVGLTVDFTGSAQQQKQHTLMLANDLELAAQEAVLDETVLGLDFFVPAGEQVVAWRWLQLQDEAWQPYALQDRDEEATVLPPGMTATLHLAGQSVVPELLTELATADAFAPEILLLPTRELTPFTLTLEGAAGSASALTADLMGRVRVDEDAPTPP